MSTNYEFEIMNYYFVYCKISIIQIFKNKDYASNLKFKI